MIQRTHRAVIGTRSANLKVMIDRRNKIYSENVVSREFILVDHRAVVNVSLELSDQSLIDPPIDPSAGTSHVSVLSAKRVFHESAEYLRNAKIRDVQK